MPNKDVADYLEIYPQLWASFVQSVLGGLQISPGMRVELSMLSASSRYMEHRRGIIHLSVFQSGCVATASAVGAKTCGYLYDIASVGRPTGARMEVLTDSQESTVVVGPIAMRTSSH